MKLLRLFFVVTDIGFVIYWGITALHLIPTAYLFRDYTNPVLVAWNWPFLPLDLLISASGFASLYLYQRGDHRWHPLALVSLILTFYSGLMALVFWVIRADFDLTWWLPNAYLLVYPLFFVPRLVEVNNVMQSVD